MANAAATHNSPVHLQRSIASALDVVGRPPPFEHALLTPKSINPNRDEAIEVREFRIAGKTYILRKDLTTTPRGGRQHKAHCRKWGEDIRLKDRTNRQDYCHRSPY
jgi:hypothetical protein